MTYRAGTAGSVGATRLYGLNAAVQGAMIQENQFSGGGLTMRMKNARCMISLRNRLGDSRRPAKKTGELLVDATDFYLRDAHGWTAH